jgi:hypothetical protein
LASWRSTRPTFLDSLPCNGPSILALAAYSVKYVNAT